MSKVDCPICNAKFCNKYDLKLHIYSDHKCKKCEICGEKFELIYFHKKYAHGLDNNKK